MAKVILLNPPGTKRYNRDVFCSGTTKGEYGWPPQDLLCLSGILDFKEIEIDVIDAIRNMTPAEEVFQDIVSSDASHLIFLTGTASWKEDIAFIERVKEAKPSLVIIALGGFLEFMGEKILKEHKEIDAILLSFVSWSIIDYINGSKEILPNIMTREYNGKIVREQSNFKYKIPRHDLFQIEDYKLPIIRRYPFTNILFSIGCVHKCTFCVYGNGTIPFMSRDVEDTIEEMKYLQEYGVKELRFTDYSVTIDKPNIRKLCNRMIEEGFNFQWHALSRVDEVDDQLLILMKKAGCRTLMFGVESGDQNILDRYAKGIDLEEIEYIFSVCKELGIETLAHFIIGLPGETEETINKTIDFSLKLKCDYADFAVAAPYIGTKLRDEALENGWIDARFRDDIYSDSAQYPTMTTPELTPEKVWKLKNKAVRKFFFRPSYIIRRLLFKTKSFKDFFVQAGVALSFLKGMRK